MLLAQLGVRPVIAHRGASGLAPENTIAALELGLEQGAEALEFDVRLAACGTPVVLHDADLDRTTSCTGPAGRRTAAELAQCDAGHWFTTDGVTYPWRGRGLFVPTLAQVLARFPETPLLIELKTVESALPVRQVLTTHGAGGRVMVASFLEGALAPFREAGFLTSASRRGILGLWLASRVGLGLRGRDRAYSVPDKYKDRLRVPTRRFVEAARRAGCPVHVWTVNDPVRARELWGLGVAGIITNFPGLMVAERARVSARGA
jgi:glycerophosphoryl diester phosphodiesterase